MEEHGRRELGGEGERRWVGREKREREEWMKTGEWKRLRV